MILRDLVYLHGIPQAGIVPGQVLRALSNPVKKGELWVLSENERLRFVRDAINTTRQTDFALVLDKEPTITADMVTANNAPGDMYPCTLQGSFILVPFVKRAYQ